jgi:hypothetical protein
MGFPPPQTAVKLHDHLNAQQQGPALVVPTNPGLSREHFVMEEGMEGDLVAAHSKHKVQLKKRIGTGAFGIIYKG